MVSERRQLYILLRVDLTSLHPTLRGITLTIDGKGLRHLSKIGIQNTVQPLFPCSGEGFIRSRDNRIHVGLNHCIHLPMNMVFRAVIQPRVDAIRHNAILRHQIGNIIGDSTGIQIGFTMHAGITQRFVVIGMAYNPHLRKIQRITGFP